MFKYNRADRVIASNESDFNGKCSRNQEKKLSFSDVIDMYTTFKAYQGDGIGIWKCLKSLRCNLSTCSFSVIFFMEMYEKNSLAFTHYSHFSLKTADVCEGIFRDKIKLCTVATNIIMK